MEIPINPLYIYSCPSSFNAPIIKSKEYSVNPGFTKLQLKLKSGQVINLVINSKFNNSVYYYGPNNQIKFCK